MAVIAAGKNPELHGIKVGIATPIIAKIFDEMKDFLPKSVVEIAPSAEYAVKHGNIDKIADKITRSYYMDI